MLSDPGLYVHLPWCVRKCPYCDFNSHEPTSDLPEAEYLTALLRDLDEQRGRFEILPFRSVFFGGGTPSLFSAVTIGQILEALSIRSLLRADTEITLEANPGTFDAARFRDYRSAGVNRLSIGVQSFDDRSLQALGRIHDGAQARAALELAATEYPTFNVDLIYGTPGQTTDRMRDDLDAALAFEPPHLSLYQLTLEPNTQFFSQPPELPDEDDAGDIEALAHSRLHGAGFQRYEVSAWAQDGHQCAHNLNYWSFGDYVAIGAGAHGKRLDARGQTVRTIHTRMPADYLRDPLGRDQAVATGDVPIEFMMNALRLANGVDEGRFEATTGHPTIEIAPTIDALTARGWLHPRPQIAATSLGWQFLDSVVAEFVPP